MSLFTEFLNLFKYNTATDGNLTFNIDTAINEPFDIIDAAIGDLDELNTTEKESLVGAINELETKAPKIGTCSTASATAEKAVVCSGFELVNSATIQITFSNANTHATPTININSQGAKSPKTLQGDALTYIPANIPLDFRYDGTNLIGLYTNTFAVMPDYANVVSKSWNTLYTAEVDGWVKFYGNYVNGTNISLEIDGVTQFLNATSSASASGLNIMVPIAKGSTYKGVNGSDSQFLMFYPMKGAK